MSLSKYLSVYLSDDESGEITSTDEEVDATQKLTMKPPATTSTLNFSAHLSISLSKVNSYRVMIFDTVDTNHDHSYNVTTGRFTAPVNGMYVFFITITSTEKLRSSLCFIHKFHPVDQGKVKEREELFQGFYTKTMAVVLKLDKEDEVWVLNATKVSEVSQMKEPYYTTFSGGLVEKQSNT